MSIGTNVIVYGGLSGWWTLLREMRKKDNSKTNPKFITSIEDS